MATPKKAQKQLDRLKEIALGYPEATEHHPWGETAIKVRDKVFIFLGRDTDRLGFSVKLPHSAGLVLTFPYAQPTGYGLGRSGWVDVSLTHPESDVDLDQLTAWLDESYRAVAPKKLIKLLEQ